MAKLVKMTGDKPDIMTIKWSSENVPTHAAINANIEENEDGTYSWDALVLPEHVVNNIHIAEKQLKYKILIIHIIRAYYDDNDATAILSNYLSEPTKEKYKVEFDKLQKCRSMAKKLAEEIITLEIF